MLLYSSAVSHSLTAAASTLQVQPLLGLRQSGSLLEYFIKYRVEYSSTR